MGEHLLLTIQIEVDVEDPVALGNAGAAKYSSGDWADGGPAAQVVAMIRDDPESAVRHALDIRDWIETAPGIRFVGGTFDTDVTDPAKPQPWRPERSAHEDFQ
jgi:hypothetical protein